MPGYQFCPKNTLLMDSFQCSVSKFHVGAPVQLLRYGSPYPMNKRLFCAFGRNFSANKRVNNLTKHNKAGWSCSFNSQSSNNRVISSHNFWLHNWNVTAKPNIHKRPQAVVNYRNRGDVSSSDADEGTSTSSGGSTMERIVQKLKKFGYIDDVSGANENTRGVIEKGSTEDIFYVEEGLLPNTRGGFSEKFPFGDESVVARGNEEVRFPWEKSTPNEQKMSLDSRKSRSLAELTLPQSEISRLRNLALRTKNKTKIGGGGVTQQVVDAIREKWKSSEVVRLKVEGPPALNMRRMHEILERKTGGLVIWRSGTAAAIYRGVAYVDPALKLKKKLLRKSETPHKAPSATDQAGVGSPKDSPLECDRPEAEAVGTEPNNRDPEKPSEMKYEDEVDELLDSLGPRFEDWPGEGPLPVDADSLPGVVPGYKPPFRLLPYGVRATLGMKDVTALRRLARGLPPHFALGRSRQHQGLAAAMVKLWERSSIAKIALKRGVQLTASERMAEDLKRLTGGILLSRNKDFLVYYRGKDFLSPDVSEALLEKERLAKDLQEEEEQARLRASTLVTPSVEDTDESRTAGTLKETIDADSRWGKLLDDKHKEKVLKEAEVLRHAELVRKLEKKLNFALKKLMKAEKTLSKVEESLDPADHPEETESITDEERFMFRKLGLRMKAYLLLGRRGVFGGTVENMHLHWKYRELVKIMVKAQNIEEVKNIALALEAESGGVLVSVDKVSKGYAIIVFRGRDYRRPPLLRPKNLLTKRKALARSIELQRHQDLLNHISTVERRVNQLRSEIEQMEAVKDKGDEELYNKLESAYPTEDDSEEEGDGDYASDSENAMVDVNIDPAHNFHLETNFPYDLPEESKTELLEP